MLTKAILNQKYFSFFQGNSFIYTIKGLDKRNDSSPEKYIRLPGKLFQTHTHPSTPQTYLFRRWHVHFENVPQKDSDLYLQFVNSKSLKSFPALSATLINGANQKRALQS